MSLAFDIEHVVALRPFRFHVTARANAAPLVAGNLQLPGGWEFGDLVVEIRTAALLGASPEGMPLFAAFNTGAPRGSMANASHEGHTSSPSRSTILPPGDCLDCAWLQTVRSPSPPCHKRYTSQMRTPCASDASGSPVGINSCPTNPP